MKASLHHLVFYRPATNTKALTILVLHGRGTDEFDLVVERLRRFLTEVTAAYPVGAERIVLLGFSLGAEVAYREYPMEHEVREQTLRGLGTWVRQLLT